MADKYTVQYNVDRGSVRTMTINAQDGYTPSKEELEEVARATIMQREGVPVTYNILSIRDSSHKLVEK